MASSVFSKNDKSRISITRVKTFCMLDNFSYFCCHMWTFSKITFSKNSFRNIIRVSNGLYKDQDGHYVCPDLDPSCLQRLSAGEMKKVNKQCL